ncbi:MAG: hypothetical protein JWP72_4075 [Massilia sp.]|nr:hypothetical protein [Massilia sp.]MDB5790297.1 hypothetical protein [Massilia sp.]
MATDQQQQQQGQQAEQNDQQQQPQQQPERAQADTTDGLADKKPEDLTPEELRLMADTMPGEGPGD